MKTERLQFKKWTFLVASLLMGGIGLLTSCNEDLESDSADDIPCIDIKVTDETSVALTRAAYAGLTTTFEDGDEIGLYAVNGTTAEYSNVKFTLTGGTWVPATKVPSKSTYTYYAYYPYSSSPATPNFAAAGDETSKFASMISGWTTAADQGTLNKFRANDLMMATGVSTSGRSVTFTMKHKMALAVVNSETVTYSYSTDPSTKYNVAVTFGGNIPYFDGANYYLFLQPNTLTAIGGQQLKAGAGKYITGSGGELTESYTLSYSTDGGSSFSSTRPTWLRGVVEDRESDDDPVNFVCTVSGEKTTSTVKSSTTTTKDVTYSPDALRAATPVSDVDLSMVNNDGTARASRTTANCYLVHAPGTYKIPLVYGNAIKNGVTNSLAYHATASGSYIKANLVNHADANINDPWIKNNGITVNAAELIWQDANGLISNVGVSGDYLTFTVSESNITAGNAVIAAKAGSDIVWSWHVWVTEETLSASTLTSITTGSHTNLSGASAPYKVAPVNIGWVPTSGSGTVTETVYAGSSCIVKINCDNGSYMTFTVTQPDYVETSGSGIPMKGYQPYYQWGRKDPLIPAVATGSGNYNHDTWNISGTQLTSSANNTVYSLVSGAYSIGTTIKNPIKHYYNSSNYGPYNENLYNYWDINNNALHNVTTATNKTVYDPCPPGFCVPTGNLYCFMGNMLTNPTSSGSRSDSNWNSTNPGKTWSATTYSSSTTGPDLFFPASGYRGSSSGTLYHVGSGGYYWSASPGGVYDGRRLPFRSSYWNWNSNNRATGFPVRAVAEE